MRRKKKYVLAVAMAALTVLGVGCGNADKPDEIVQKPQKTEETSVGSGVADALEASPVPTGDDTGEAEGIDEKNSDDPLNAYYEVLDMFYYKILNGWDQTEDVSYMFYWDYTYVHSLSDAGYMLTDMNGDGMPELLVSTVTDAADGLIYDLYSCVDGEVVHVASSGERYQYYLNDGNTIYYEASSGASNSTFAGYNIDSSDGSLKMEEVVMYDESQNKDNPWFYSAEDCYDKTSEFDCGRMDIISEEEAQEIIGSYKAVALDLTLFSSYFPQEKTH